jgi:hypothetical protein
MLVEKGETNKVIKTTHFNLKSSRSHTVLEIVLQKANKKESRLVLCDLAGSERFTDEKAKNKVLLTESNNINKSLSTLAK